MNLQQFEAHLRAVNRSERTVEAYTEGARRFLEFLREREISVAILEEWTRELRASGLKPQSVAVRLAAVRSLLGHAAAHGDDSAAQVLAILANYQITPKVKETDVKQPRTVSMSDYEAARNRAGRHKPLIDILWFSGCRVSEALALTVQDGWQILRQGYAVVTGKGGRRRLIIMPSAGREALSDFLATRPTESSYPLFPMSRQAVWAILRRLGLPNPHAFRHAYRARLRAAGIGDELQRRLLGHGPAGITSHYGVAGPEELLQAVEALA